MLSVRFSHSAVSDSLQSRESQHARPPCPSPTPGVHSDSRPSSRWCHPAISSNQGVIRCRQILYGLSHQGYKSRKTDRRPTTPSIPIPSHSFSQWGQRSPLWAEGKGLKGCGEKREVIGERRSPRSQSWRATDVTIADSFPEGRRGRSARYYSEVGLEFFSCFCLSPLLLGAPCQGRSGAVLRSLPRVRELE